MDVIGLFYFVAALYCVSRYRRSLFGRFSNLDRINLRWLSGLLSVLILLWLASMTEYVSSLNLLAYVHASWMLIMYVIAYLNLFQAQILAGPEVVYELVPELEATPETPQISEPARRAASEEPRLEYQETRRERSRHGTSKPISACCSSTTNPTSTRISLYLRSPNAWAFRRITCLRC